MITKEVQRETVEAGLAGRYPDAVAIEKERHGVFNTFERIEEATGLPPS